MPYDRPHDRNSVAYIDETDKTLLSLLLLLLLLLFCFVLFCFVLLSSSAVRM